MAGDHKPQGHNAVSVYLISPDAEATVAFLVNVFGAEPGRLLRRDNGSVMHAEVKIDDSIVMIGQPEGPASGSGMVHVYVADPEAVFDRAIDNGATVIHPVERRQTDTDLRGGFTDPWGNAWFVARQVADQS